MASNLLVIDNSVNSRLIWPDTEDPANNRYAIDVIASIEDGNSVVVPTIWHYECAQVAMRLLNTARLTQATVFSYFEQLSELPIYTDIESHSHCTSTILALADEYSLSIYNAAYLELALRQSALLASNDVRLNEAADRAGADRFPRSSA